MPGLRWSIEWSPMPIKKRIGQGATHSDCRSSEASSFPRILAVVVSKVQNCSIIPCQWAHETHKKTEEREDIITILGRSGKCSKTSIWDFTYENHPIPHPKHGRGLSYNPIGESSSSLIRVYLPFSRSPASVACPVKKQHYIHRFGIKQD